MDEATKTAQGQLDGILSQRRREGLEAGPFAALDPANPADQRIIGSLYAGMAREAMGTSA